MKGNNYDVDLISYIALSEISKQDNTVNAEDISSKMAIHARKLKDNPSNVVLRI